MSSDIMVKLDLPFRGILRNEAREMTACSTHVLLSRLDVARSFVVEVNGLDSDVRVTGPC